MLHIKSSSLHSSLATAPPKLASKAAIAAAFPASAHSRIRPLASTSIVGEVLSSMVIVLVSTVTLSQSSVAVKVTVVTPVRPHKSIATAVSKS